MVRLGLESHPLQVLSHGVTLIAGQAVHDAARLGEPRLDDFVEVTGGRLGRRLAL